MEAELESNLMQQICSMCLEKGEPEKLSGDKGHSLIRCSKCGLKVHLRCYGEGNTQGITSNNTQNSRTTEAIFECQKCANKDSASVCMICRQNEGYMQKLEGKKYIHTLCALFFDYFEVADFRKMKVEPRMALSKIEKTLGKKGKVKCVYCDNSQGVLLDCECESEECGNKTHFYCAQKEKISKLLNDADASDFWQIEWKLISENENPQDEVRIRSGKNWFLKNRGGKIRILCADHRDKINYCLCRKDSTSEFMLCCDNCETWFHGRCVGYSNKEVNTLKRWYCSFCTEWINNRNNYLLKEANEDHNDDLISQAKEKNWRQPIIHNHIYYRLIDLIFMAVLYTRKADVLVNNICSLELLSKHIKTASQIPLVLYNSVLRLKQKLDKFTSKKIEEDRNVINQLKNFDFTAHSIISLENGKKNQTNYEIILKNCTLLSDLYKNYLEKADGIIDDDIGVISDLLKKFKWGVDAVNVIDNKEASMADIKTVYLAYNDSFRGGSLGTEVNTTDVYLNASQPFSDEYSIISDFMTSYSNWQKSTKEMLNEHVKRKKEGEKVEKEIEAAIKKEEMSETLNSKLNVVNKKREKFELNLKSKIPKDEIEDIISTGSSLRINVSKELVSIETCLQEAVEWQNTFLTYKSQTKPLEDYLKLLQGLDNILVSTPLMYDAVNLIFTYQIYDIKADFYLKNQNNLTEKTFNEICTLLQNIQNSELKDANIETKCNNLSSIVDRINSIRDNVKSKLNTESDLTELKLLKESLERDNKLFKKEIEKIDQKMFYLQNLENLLATKNDMTSLENIERLVHEYNINDVNNKFATLIKEKKNTIERIRDTLKRHFSENTMPSEGECLALVKEIRESNLILEEEEIIKDYLSIYQLTKEIEEKNISDLSESELVNVVERIRPLDHLIKGDVRTFYEKIHFLIWIKRATRVVETLNQGDMIDHTKLTISEIFALKDQRQLRPFNEPDFDRLNAQIEFYCNILTKCDEMFQTLTKLTYEEGLSNLSQAKDLINHLLENYSELESKVEISERVNKVQEINILIEISEKLNSLLEKKKEETDKRMDMERVKQIITECENKLTNKLSSSTAAKNTLKLLSSFQQIKTEIEKFDSWMEKHNQYIAHKRSNQVDKIDLSLLEVLIEESKKLISNVSQQVGLLRRDLEGNKSWIDSAKRLLDISDNYNQIDAILENEDSIKTLKKLYEETTSISIADKNLIDAVKTLEWATRARALLKNTTDNINYRMAFRTSQEANLLKLFPEIKKKDYYTALMQQVTLAKNIKDISEMLRNHTHSSFKQITEEQFDKIMKEFSSKCLIQLPEEKETVDNFARNKSEITRKFDTMSSSHSSLTEWEKYLNELKKFPIKLDKLVQAVEGIISEGKTLQKEVKKLLDQHKLGKVTLNREKVTPLYEKMKNSHSTFSESDQLTKMYENSIENLNKIKSALSESEGNVITEFDLYELISLFDTIEVHSSAEEKQLKKTLWNKKYDILVQEDALNKGKKISIDTLKNLYSEALELHIHEGEAFTAVSDLRKKSEEILKRLRNAFNKEDLDKIREEADKEKIDISDQIIEQEVKISMSKVNNFGKIQTSTGLIGNKRKNTDKSMFDKVNKKKHYEEEIEIELSSDDEKIAQDMSSTQNKSNIDPTSTIAATRSRRNISVKIDKDYFYDKDFLENFGSNKNSSKNNVQSSAIEENEDYILLQQDHEKKVLTNFDTEEPINASVLSELISKSKAASQDAHVPTKRLKKPESKAPKQEKKSAHIALAEFEKILSENPIFMREGRDFILKIAKSLEEDLVKSFPDIEAVNKKALDNMEKTVKELEKYKKVSNLIVKGKLDILKVSRFPYGNKYFEKLKKIESSSNKHQEKKEPKQETNLITMMKNMQDLYSSLTKPEKKAPSEIKPVKSVMNLNEELSLDEDDNGSLKSLSDREEPRFSPGGHYRKDEDEKLNKSVQNNSTMLAMTTKSSSVQSPSSPTNVLTHKESNLTTNTIDMSGIVGKIYNPFDIYEEDTRANETKEDSGSSLMRTNSNNTSRSQNSKLNLNKMKKFLIQPIFYDPTKKKETIVKDNKDSKDNKEGAIKKTTAQPNSTLQIWKGEIHVSKLVDMKDFLMCSTNPIQEFESIQAFPNKIQISSKAKTREVIPYIEKYLVNKTKTVLSGWFEVSEASEINNYNKLAEDYDKNDRSGFIQMNGEKVYIFTLSQRHSKFYKKMKNEIKIHNKALMNKIEKLLVFVIIKKGSEDEEAIKGEAVNYLDPVVLTDIVKDASISSSKTELDHLNQLNRTGSNESVDIKDKQQESIEKKDVYMSPITSEEEDSDEEGNNQNLNEENKIHNKAPSEPQKDRLVELLQSDNLELLEDYVNTQFANLGQEEIIEKLMSLDEFYRNKLLKLIMEYQQRVGGGQTGEGYVEDKNNDDVNMEEDASNNVNDYMEVDQEGKEENTYTNQGDTGTALPVSAPKVNENLTYLGFSGVNTDLLKGEILKTQNQSQQNQNIISEDQLKMMNQNVNTNMPLMPMNMNPNYAQMMNMNQMYMMNQMRMMNPHLMMQQGQGQSQGGQNIPNYPGMSQNFQNMNQMNQMNQMRYPYPHRKNTKFHK